MYLKSLELSGFKSFAKKSRLEFNNPISAIVGPNGSGKSNIAEAFRFCLGEQSIKSLRGKRGEDLIWNGSSEVPRVNRASARLTFNNEKRFLDIDFDEVSIERVVHRDGTNTYAINDSQVRLRDIVLLLAGAHIGSSGYHIISQGEADRILSAHPKERREMIEDALGLKVYQYKKRESEKRLAKCEDNIAHVESLRREIAPHLKFLRKQVEKVEKSRALRDTLKEAYYEYLTRESAYVTRERAGIVREKNAPETERAKLRKELAKATETLEARGTHDNKSRQLISLEEAEKKVREEKETLSRDIGRVEGQIAFAENRREEEKSRTAATGAESVPLESVRDLHAEVTALIDEAEESDDPSALTAAVALVREAFSRFFKRAPKGAEKAAIGTEMSDVSALLKERDALSEKMSSATAREENMRAEYAALRDAIEAEKSKERDAERALFSIREKQNIVEATLAALSHRESAITRAAEDLERERTEAVALLGPEIQNTPAEDETFSQTGEDGGAPDEPREKQEVRRRELEKMKIRLEEFGGGEGSEIIKEHQELSERDEFLEREIADLHASADSLRQLITELDEKLATKFKEGIVTINKEFQNLFSLMFGGGSAALSVSAPPSPRRSTRSDFAALEAEGEEEEEEEAEDSLMRAEEGVEVAVSLPKKRIKGLHMLSGGERALTSIALLFACVSVNPPPFLVLDETDAALDEANSRRYGDMIERLATRSQLILITHNRETMSRTGLLYGVTMGHGGVSKLLSVSFDEAVTVAK